MNNLKNKNIKNTVWHIKRHLDELLNFQDEKPYPFLDRDEVF